MLNLMNLLVVFFLFQDFKFVKSTRPPKIIGGVVAHRSLERLSGFIVLKKFERFWFFAVKMQILA